jgi:hypothetical protein
MPWWFATVLFCFCAPSLASSVPPKKVDCQITIILLTTSYLRAYYCVHFMSLDPMRRGSLLRASSLQALSIGLAWELGGCPQVSLMTKGLEAGLVTALMRV